MSALPISTSDSLLASASELEELGSKEGFILASYWLPFFFFSFLGVVLAADVADGDAFF
jgi:hypothetical protein